MIINIQSKFGLINNADYREEFLDSDPPTAASGNVYKS